MATRSNDVADFRIKDQSICETSSRPERSEVEGSAVVSARRSSQRSDDVAKFQGLCTPASVLILALHPHQPEPPRHRKTSLIRGSREPTHLRIRLHQYAGRSLCRRRSRIGRRRIGLLLPKSTQAESAQLTVKH